MEYIALIHNLWPGGKRYAAKHFVVPLDWKYSPEDYFMQEVDYTSELVQVIPASEWLGEI